jgi:hypothetical protein
MTHQVPLNSLNTSVCSQKSILSHSSQAIKPASKLFATDPVIEMPRVLEPFRFVLIAVAGWMNQRQLQIIITLARRIGFFASNFHFTMSRCRPFIASTKLLLSVLFPGGVCTAPVRRPWRPLLQVAVALPLPLARAPPRWNGEGQRSSDHRRSSLAVARIQRRWRNLALRPPSNTHKRV